MTLSNANLCHSLNLHQLPAPRSKGHRMSLLLFNKSLKMSRSAPEGVEGEVQADSMHRQMFARGGICFSACSCANEIIMVT